MKYKYYVAILYTNGRQRFVTGIHPTEKYAMWEFGKEAKAFTLSGAKNLVFGLVCNGFPAVVVTAPDTFDMVNPKEEDWE